MTFSPVTTSFLPEVKAVPLPVVPYVPATLPIPSGFVETITLYVWAKFAVIEESTLPMVLDKGFIVPVSEANTTVPFPHPVNR